MRIGFIGAGKMAAALARGFARTLPNGSKQIMASCPPADVGLADDLKRMGCVITHSNLDLVTRNDVVLMAIKPAVVPVVLKEVKGLLTPDKLVVSMAAGVKLATIEQELDSKAKVVRVMPNTPCLVGEGATVYSIGTNCTSEEGEIVRSLFKAVGSECHVISEYLIDAATGISGSGPAYMYIIIEAMADAGVKKGIPRELAYRLAAQTMVGAGKMVLNTGKHPAILKDDVCSPSGSTITALHELERNGLRNTMIQGVEAAIGRCTELGR